MMGMFTLSPVLYYSSILLMSICASFSDLFLVCRMVPHASDLHDHVLCPLTRNYTKPAIEASYTDMDFSHGLADQTSPWPLPINGNEPLLYNVPPSEHSEDFNVFSLAGIDPGPLRILPHTNTTVPALDETTNSTLPIPFDAPNIDSQAIDQSSQLLAFRGIDNKTLDVYNFSGEPRSITIAAHLSGNFSVSNDAQGEFENLVCYRRNLFHIDGSILVPSDLGLVSTNTDQSQIDKVYAELVAFSNYSREQVKIVALPRTSRTAPNLATQSPLPKQLDFRHSAGSSNLHTSRLDWTRLQFRTATTKAGGTKHRKSQNFFQISIQVKASTTNGNIITLCEAATLPIVVRGRSPKNFRTPQETLSTSRVPTARNELIHRPEATSSHFANPEPSSVLPDPTEVFDDIVDTDRRTQGIHADQRSVEHHANFANTPIPNVQPPQIFNNVIDAEDSPAIVNSETTQGHDGRFPSASTTSSSVNSERIAQNNSFYRYIPLAADDRTPAVQAVYQPHYVHHKIITPTETLSLNKRYFGEPPKSL